MSDLITEFVKRPASYYAIDGVDEMLIGFWFLSSTLVMHAINIASESSIWHWKYILLVANAVLLISFMVGRKLLKERITYRRTGYAKYRYSKVESAIRSVIGFVVGVAVVTSIAIFLPRAGRDRYLIVLGSVLWAGLYVYFFVYKAEMYRAYKYLSALLMVVGPLAVYSAFKNTRDIATLTVLVLGTCFLISGVITFWSYLRNTHAAADSPDGTQ